MSNIKLRFTRTKSFFGVQVQVVRKVKYNKLQKKLTERNLFLI